MYEVTGTVAVSGNLTNTTSSNLNDRFFLLYNRLSKEKIPIYQAAISDFSAYIR